MKTEERKMSKVKREPMVTRTITSTEIIVLGVSEMSGEASNRTYIAPFKIDDKEKALKFVIKENHDTDYHPSIVVSIEHNEKVMGITIKEFMEMAVEVIRPVSQQKPLN
jgi:hypothetical protein